MSFATDTSMTGVVYLYWKGLESPPREFSNVLALLEELPDIKNNNPEHRPILVVAPCTNRNKVMLAIAASFTYRFNAICEERPNPTEINSSIVISVDSRFPEETYLPIGKVLRGKSPVTDDDTAAQIAAWNSKWSRESDTATT